MTIFPSVTCYHLG